MLGAVQRVVPYTYRLRERVRKRYREDKMKKVIQIILALIAPIAGIITGRPYSGLWLAHYFLGSGKEKQLPRKLEEQLAIFWLEHKNRNDGDILDADYNLADYREGKKIEYQELAHIPDEVELICVGYPIDENTPDLYTTVGALVLWENDEELYYLDVYNWHRETSWQFKFAPSWLPFSMQIRGQDETWTKLGKPFVTTGRITL